MENLTPPPELVEQWCEQLFGCSDKPEIAAYELARLAAEWAADMELYACCEWVGAISGKYGPRLRAARRPKPPSLKEQALEALDRMDQLPTLEDMHVVRRALEQLDD